MTCTYLLSYKKKKAYSLPKEYIFVSHDNFNKQTFL